MLAPAVGRPPEPDEETSHKLWRALSAHLTCEPNEPLDAQQYLAVHEESGAPMRAIWNLAQRWLEYGDVDTCEGRNAVAPEASSAACGVVHRAARG